MNAFEMIVVAIFSLILGGMMGYAIGHTTVATECKRLGAFYVGETIYECKVKHDL